MRQKRSRSRVHLSAGPERLPSPGAPRVTLARAVQDPPPCSGLCRHGAGFRRLGHLTPACAESKLDLPRDPGLITPGRAGQTPPVDFCNHHGSQARPRKPDPLTLHAPQRVTPLRSATAGSPALARERRPSCLESRGRHGLTSTPAPLRTMTRRRALPRTDRPGHLMSQKRARTQPEEPDAEVRDVVPTFPPSNRAQGAVRMRARAPLTSAKKIPDRAPEVPFCTMDSPKAGAVSTSCYQPVDWSHDAFVPPRAPFSVDVLSGLRRVDCP